MSTVDTAQHCPLHAMDIVQYCQTDIVKYRKNTPDITKNRPQNIRSIVLNTVHTLFDGYCSILSTEYSKYIAQYYPQNIRWILLNTVHRIFNRYCSILYTEYSMYIAQYCPQNIQQILLNTVHKPFNVFDNAQ
jgi:hypothetical protein